MSRPTGQFIKLSDDSYKVILFLGRDPLTRKRRYYSKTIRGTYNDASKYVSKALREIQAGTFAPYAAMLAGKFQENKAAKQVNGFIYCHYAPEVQRVKIGYSAVPHARHSNQQVGSPVELIPIACWPGTRRMEKTLHARFEHLWERGEFYASDNEILQYIQEQMDSWLQTIELRKERCWAGSRKRLQSLETWVREVLIRNLSRARATQQAASLPSDFLLYL